MKIDPKEKELHGSIILREGELTFDDINKRISELINSHLIFVKTDKSGWSKLYIDPDDSRYWELTFPESEIQGGGAYSLSNISQKEAQVKYEII
jgi:hypothetical protein